MVQSTEGYEEPGLKEMLVSLCRNMTALLKQEIYFGKEELSNSLFRLKKGMVFLAVGAAIGYSGLLVLLAAAVVALARLESVSLWLSALMVGFAVLLIGLLFLLNGIKKVKLANLKPHLTIEVVKEDVTWIKNQMS
jgi:Putative Actinobacterial Holin-X, holin superfamily III